MSKALPILGIVSAVLAALTVGNITPGPVLPFLALALLAATSVMLFMGGGKQHMILGIVVAVLALLPLLYFTPVQGNQKDIIPDAGSFARIQLLPILCLVPLVLVTIGRRARFEPMWIGWLALGFAALVALLAILIPAADYGTVGALGIVGALLSLILIWPMVVLMRAGESQALTQVMAEPAKAPDVVAAKPKPKSAKK